MTKEALLQIHRWVLGAALAACCLGPQTLCGQTLSIELQNSLKDLWMTKEGAEACLQALDLYTSKPPDADRALKILIAALPKGPDKKPDSHLTDVYTVAGKKDVFWYAVATATKEDLVDLNGVKVARDQDMFASADTDAGIGAMYKSSLSKLADVAAEKAQMRALFLLLSLVPKTDVNAWLNQMQCYRACFKRNPAALFDLAAQRTR